MYADCFPAAIADWRVQFGSPGLPFLFVQIGPSSSNRMTDVFGNRNDSYGLNVMALRAAQLKALALPAVGVATATDVGDPGCIAGVPPCLGTVGDNGLAEGHPRLKAPVGARLADVAMRLVYNKSSPTPAISPKLVSVVPAPSGAVILTFDSPVVLGNTTMCGLFKVTGTTLTGACCTASPFEVLVGSEWRRTELPGLTSPSSSVVVPMPPPSGLPYMSLRYAWVDTPMCMLFRGCSGSGGQACPDHPLPVLPFNVSL